MPVADPYMLWGGNGGGGGEVQHGSEVQHGGREFHPPVFADAAADALAVLVARSRHAPTAHAQRAFLDASAGCVMPAQPWTHAAGCSHIGARLSTLPPQRGSPLSNAQWLSTWQQINVFLLLCQHAAAWPHADAALSRMHTLPAAACTRCPQPHAHLHLS
eukprot:354206-Chlamydomonas_euryale.AAC.1